MLRATLRGVVAHKLRLGLTALAVTLGVAFVAGTLVLTDTIGRTFDRVFAAATAGTDVSVRAESDFGSGAAPVPADVIGRVSAVDGVRAAEGTLLGYAQVVDADGKAVGGGRSTPIGAAWITEPGLNPLTLRSGRAPRAGNDVVIDAGTAKAADLAVGDRVRVVFQGPAGEFTVVGIAGFGDADEVAGATLTAFAEPTARRVLNRPEGFDSVEIAAEDGVAQADLRTRVAAVLGPGLEAVTGQAAAKESAEAVRQDLGFFSTLLLVFAGVSLFVGAFIIVNTFQILVAQRSRELGLLRALGATAAQVRRSVVAEAAVVGLIASVVGLAVGVGVAIALQRLLEAFGVELPASETRVLPRTVAISIAVGMVVTLVSAIVPARRASRVPPLAALRDDAGFDPATSLRRRTVAGALVAAIGFAILLAGTAGMGNGAANVGIGALIGFLGASLMAPAVVRPLVAVIAAPLAGRSVAARLGRENAVRNPRRTAATAAALMIGLALVSLVSIFAASARRSTSAIIDDVFRADLVVSGDERSGGFSPELATQLRALPEVATVAEFRVGQWRLDGQDRFLTATSPDNLGAVLDLDVVAGRLADLGDGGMLVTEDEATSRGWGVGDVVPMEFARTGIVPVRIDAIYEANQITGDYLLSLKDYETNFADQLDAFALVAGAPSAEPTTVRTAVNAVVKDFANVEVTDQDEFKAQVAGQVTQILNLFYALLGLAIVIAVLGVVNTLALSIFERTRELGLLRAVGTSRRQVGAMVRTEGTVISVLGAVLGLVIGLVVALAMLAALREKGITETAVPVVRLLVFVGLAGVAGLLAAALPARRAARIDILAAIAHE